MIKIDEKDLETIIFNALSDKDAINSLAGRGLDLRVFDTWMVLRQVQLYEYGIADIVKIDMSKGYIHVHVVELKVVKFSHEHLIQLGRYMTCINQIVSSLNLSTYKINITGTLVVSDFDSTTDSTWFDKIISSSVSVYSTKYGLNGITFSKELPNGWKLTDVETDLERYIDISSLRNLYRIAYAKHVPHDNLF